MVEARGGGGSRRVWGLLSSICWLRVDSLEFRLPVLGLPFSRFLGMKILSPKASDLRALGFYCWLNVANLRLLKDPGNNRAQESLVISP